MEENDFLFYFPLGGGGSCKINAYLFLINKFNLRNYQIHSIEKRISFLYNNFYMILL